MPTDDDAVRPGSDNRRAVRRARARANRRKRPPLRQRIPGPAEIARQVAGGVRRRRRAIASCAVAAGLVAAGYAGGRYLGSSDRFAVARVELRGAERVSVEALRERLSYLGGANIFAASLDRAEEHLEALPWVESARVSRDLPDRLEAEVVEHEPVAVAHLGGLYLVSETGEPFVRVSPSDEAVTELVAITGLDRETYARDPEAGQDRIRRALAAVETYREGERPRLGEVHIGARGDLTFSTYEGAVAIRADISGGDDVEPWLRGFDAAWASLDDRERATASMFRIQGSGAPERVTVDFSGIRAGN